MFVIFNIDTVVKLPAYGLNFAVGTANISLGFQGIGRPREFHVSTSCPPLPSNPTENSDTLKVFRKSILFTNGLFFDGNALDKDVVVLTIAKNESCTLDVFVYKGYTVTLHFAFRSVYPINGLNFHIFRNFLVLEQRK